MTVIFEKGFAQTIEKSNGAILASGAPDPLFTITGGPIMVTEFVGIVSADIGGASNCHIDLTTTTPAVTTALSTNVAIDSNVAGTSYTFTVDALAVLTPTTNGLLTVVPRIAWLCPIGTIYSHTSTARAGNIKWYMSYIMLSQYSKVVAAA